MDTDRFFSLAVELTKEYVAGPTGRNGGSLHIVLADGNTDAGHVSWCADYAREEEDVAGIMLAKVLLLLTEEERDQIYEMHL